MQNLLEHWETILTILALIGIEIAPIKISPFTWLGRIFGRLLGIEEIKDKVDNLEHKVNDLDKNIDDVNIKSIASRISNFEILTRSSKNKIEKWQYDTIFKDIDKWREYHKKYPDLNGMLKIAIENIEEAYKKANFYDK